jgi:hypothetical protein
MSYQKMKDMQAQIDALNRKFDGLTAPSILAGGGQGDGSVKKQCDLLKLRGN